jgi:cell division protein FtsN
MAEAAIARAKAIAAKLAGGAAPSQPTSPSDTETALPKKRQRADSNEDDGSQQPDAKKTTEGRNIEERRSGKIVEKIYVPTSECPVSIWQEGVCGCDGGVVFEGDECR